MSEEIKKLSNFITEDLLHELDSLNLSPIEKHHVRLLLHCLQVFTAIKLQNNNSSLTNQDLWSWSEIQSSKFEDKVFSELLYKQMCSARNKLEQFSKTINKDLLDLNLDDIVLLTQEHKGHEIDDPKEKM